MNLATDKIGTIIHRAREFAAKVGAWEEPSVSAPVDDAPETILEDLPGDATQTELRAFIDGLNEDEQAELVALVWLGRGDFEPLQWDEAVQTALERGGMATSSYLLGMPLLPENLEDGLAKLGFTVSEIESDALNSRPTN